MTIRRRIAASVHHVARYRTSSTDLVTLPAAVTTTGRTITSHQYDKYKQHPAPQAPQQMYNTHFYRTMNIGRRPREIEFSSKMMSFSSSTFDYPNSAVPTINTARNTPVRDDDHDGQQQQQRKDSKERPFEPKPWFDTHRSLDVRINELLDVDTIHPADIVHPMMEDLIKQCCRATNSQNAIAGLQRGQEVLYRCLVEKRRYQMTTDLKLFVPQKLFQTLIFGWSKIAHKEYVAQARMKEIIQLAIEEGKMDDAFLHTKLSVPRTKRIASDVYPTVYLFNTYLIGLGNASKITPQAALDSEAILFDMVEYNRTMGWHTKPNTRSYTHVIMAYANTQHVAAGRRAFKILQQMKEVHAAEKDAYEERYQIPYNYLSPKENKHQIVTLDAATYSATLKALQISNRSPELVMDLLIEAGQAPGVVLDAMLFVVTITSLAGIIDKEINAMQRIKLAQEAESILRTMIQHGTTTGFQKLAVGKAFEYEIEESRTHLFDDEDQNENENATDHADNVSSGDSQAAASSIENDDISLTNDIDHKSDPTNVNHASEVDASHPGLHYQTVEESRKSMQIGYNACIHAWAQSYCSEGAIRCEELLQEMLDSKDVLPNTATFNTCLYAWSKSHRFHEDAGRRAIELLNRQFHLSAPNHIGDDVKPDFQSFTSCILVQSKSTTDDRLQLASALLSKLLEEIKLGNLSVTRNPTGPFSAVLTTIANYKMPKTTDNATTIDNDENSKIDVFNTAIDTQNDPYSMALSIFDQIERDVHGIGTTVDHHCVTAFLKCILAHGVPGSTEREHTSRRVFQDTCQAGYVSRQVLKEFQNILGPAASTFPDLRNPPKFWSRNVPSTFR